MIIIIISNYLLIDIGIIEIVLKGIEEIGIIQTVMMIDIVMGF